MIRKTVDRHIGFMFAFLLVFISIGSPAANTEEGLVLKGICFSPIRTRQDPDCGVLPTQEEIREELEFMKKARISGRIRTYSCLGTMGIVPSLCEDLEIECWPGAWLGKYPVSTEREMQSLIAIGKRNLSHVPVLIVGNEVLLRNDMTEEQLIDAILRVKRETGAQVAYAEIGAVLLQHPKVVDAVDVVLVHLYPYWEGKSIEQAVPSLVQQWKQIREAYPEKQVLIGETGWPSTGETNSEALPSPENQARYFKEFLDASAACGIDYFYFALFAERWKAKQEGVRGAHWGLFSAEGQLNPYLPETLPAEMKKGLNRNIGLIPATETLHLPAFVYREGHSEENCFYPTNWMGDVEDLTIDEFCTDQPHSGNECLMIQYVSKGKKTWAGIYWIGPYINHWGDYPGYAVSDAKKLIFWARGQKGGEYVKFTVGGIENPVKPFRDSFGPLESSLHLSNDWRPYSIDLGAADTSMILGGFCISISALENPEGCTFFLDDIAIRGQGLGKTREDVKATLSSRFHIDRTDVTYTQGKQIPYIDCNLIFENKHYTVVIYGSSEDVRALRLTTFSKSEAEQQRTISMMATLIEAFVDTSDSHVLSTWIGEAAQSSNHSRKGKLRTEVGAVCWPTGEEMVFEQQEKELDGIYVLLRYSTESSGLKRRMFDLIIGEDVSAMR